MSDAQLPDYLQRVGSIVGDDVSDGAVNLNLTWTNRDDAKASIAKLRQMQAELRVLRQQVGRDMAAVRSEFITKRTAIGKSVTSIVAGAVFGRRNVGRANAVTRDLLRREQMTVLEPFEKAQRLIDSVIRALNEARASIEASAEYRNH